jgi:outer membrane protein OmpA-like peptidoglycan-associated protein
MAAVAALASSAPGRAQERQTPPPPPQNTLLYAAGQEVKVSGWIVSRRGDDFLIRDETTHQLSWVTITPSTTIQSKSGILDLERKAKDPSSLVAGLLVQIKGEGGPGGNLVASKVSFHGRALRTAKQIDAGEVELKAQQRQVAAVASANRDTINAAMKRARDSLDALQNKIDSMSSMAKTRFENLDNFDVRFKSSVNFATGSAKLDSAARATLDSLVQQSTSMDGYVIEVVGFADSTGAHDMNRRLSMRRADAVVSYLTEKHSIPARRIATPVGLGDSKPVSDNMTAEGRAANRRVEVRVLVNRGIKP